MMKNKKWILLVVILLVVVVLAFASSYALFRFNVTKDTNFQIAIGTLELTITDTTTEDKFIMESTVPTKDDVALAQEGYTFTLKNTGNIDSYYTVYLDDILLSDSGDRLDNSYVKLNLFNHDTNQSNTNRLSNYPETDRVLTTGILKAGDSITYTLRMWVDYSAGNEAQNKYFATQIRVVGTQQSALGYQEDILNGATPVLTDNLIPIEIADDGTVTRANIQEEWYSYADKRWANAVVLKEDKTYKVDEVIPEDNIESYFVWIPKYSYQLWDLGDYSSLTTIDSTKPHAIPIRFGITNTEDGNIGECTTPMNEDGTQGLAGESGNCKVGDYMTHPAFLAFDTNGLWVGKFETGYDGATSTEEAEINNIAIDKIVIKPNVYSWRYLSLGNVFENSYNYLRSNESHMMKNTEWGAVTYLSHSIYGTCTDDECSEVRINNNKAYITGYSGTEEPTKSMSTTGTSVEGNRYEITDLNVDGTYTKRYNSEIGFLASTSKNITGIYDMRGGAWEYVMGYTAGATTAGGSSEIITLHSDFLTKSSWEKYYDKYASTGNRNYNNRILGDALGEMGPFASYTTFEDRVTSISSWYGDEIYFADSQYPWFARGGNYVHGKATGIFMYTAYAGESISYLSFRIVLAPTK